MLFWLMSALGLGIAYLLGSTPTGFLAGKFLKGIDIREHGSNSTGATNVLRTLGLRPFAAVLAIDALKGAAAIVFIRWLSQALLVWPATKPAAWVEPSSFVAWAVCLAGLAVLLGHARSIWLNFTGGKSVAAGVGVLAAMSWTVALGALTVFGVTLALFRIMSVSSMLAALTAVALVCGLDEPLPYRVLVIAGAAFVIVRHRANIKRLLAGTEPRLGRTSQPGVSGR
ncbi:MULTISPECIES: glycerol-3-phosphate 1-O-acyltransferase PlsY [Phenylobacterium]|uniref:Glycerol-3-phosphate acyltransferase n=1 Tax=Phenylobacterium koreense TaxID=266125 RepID=A0ABV2EDG6_9CAUL